MNRKLLAVALLAALSGLAYADSIDDAEAKKRGVSVEVVQLENAKAKIADLEKSLDTAQAKATDDETKLKADDAQIATLQAENQKLTDSLTPAAKAKLAAGDSIEQAIKEKRLVKGMTLAQAQAAMGGKGALQHQGDDGVTSYEWKLSHGRKEMESVGTRHISTMEVTVMVSDGIYDADFQDGKLTHWEKSGGK